MCALFSKCSAEVSDRVSVWADALKPKTLIRTEVIKKKA